MEDLVASFAGGPQILTLIVSLAAVISALVPDEKMPGWLGKLLNAMAMNVGKAKNSPNQ